MNQDFRKCLEKNKIVHFKQGTQLIEKELRAAKDDLESAEIGLQLKKFKWPTIQAYYSMFHSARALLYSKGYREKSHYCLLIAIKALFVEKGYLEADFTDAFYAGMILRENADYKGSFTESGALSIISNASSFFKRVCRILNISD